MENLDEILESLHPLERQVLQVLEDGFTSNKIVEKCELKEIEIMRALQWLSNKEIIKLDVKINEIVKLDKNGEKYLKEGLPEKRFLEVLKEFGKLSLNQIKEKANLDKDETSISLGLLKKKGLIAVGKEILIVDKGKEFLEKEYAEEKLINKLKEGKDISLLDKDEKEAYENLKKRKEIVKLELVKTHTVKLTELGKKLEKLELKEDLIEGLTTSMIKTSSWKDKKFRRYDVKSKVPVKHTAKRHFVNQAVNYIKRIWLDMGFEEMQGPMVDSSFWNFDALFTPQDHPAREMQDTFFVEGEARLPEKKLVNAVKKEHEESWKYKWDEKIAKELVLRPHTTCLSARTLAKLKESDVPAKFFSVNRVFRNEALDWSHLFE